MTTNGTEIKLVEFFDEHWYKIELENKEIIWCASVSTKLGVIAKPFLARWRGDIGNREADLRVYEASERGVRIHNAWYVLSTGGAIIYQPNLKPIYTNEEIANISETHEGNIAILRNQDEMWAVVKLSKWVEAVKPKFIQSELTVYSLEHKEAGTLDNVLLINEGEYLINGAKPVKIEKGLYLVDLKTGNQIPEEVGMQIAAYTKCYEEMYTAQIKGGLVIHTEAKTKKGIEGISTVLWTREELTQEYDDFRHASAIWERKHKDAKPDTFIFPSLISLKETHETEKT